MIVIHVPWVVRLSATDLTYHEIVHAKSGKGGIKHIFATLSDNQFFHQIATCTSQCTKCTRMLVQLERCCMVVRMYRR